MTWGNINATISTISPMRPMNSSGPGDKIYNYYHFCTLLTIKQL